MISLAQFQALDGNEKAQATSSRGIFLAERKEDFILIELYRVDDFYVEVFYMLNKKMVLHYMAFKSSELLVPYLKHIKLNY